VGYTELFSFVTWTSVGIMGATAAVAGQNLGAGKPERTARAVQIAAGIGLTMATFFGLLYVLIPRSLLAIFGMTDPDTVRIGVQLLAFLSVSGLFITVALAYTGGLQGTGDTKSPFYISLISQVAVPIGICATLQAMGNLTPAGIWIAIVVGHATRCGLSVLRFRQEKWRHIKIAGAPAPA
jgi:Na+-driven multidrug efflux pump